MHTFEYGWFKCTFLQNQRRCLWVHQDWTRGAYFKTEGEEKVSSSISQSSCLKADSSFIWKTTTHNRFVLLFTSEFHRVLKRNSSELIAMKHKLNYTVEVDSKLTTLSIFFILRIRERKLVRWLLEVEVFAWDAAELHSLKLLKSSTKHKHVKELNTHFLEWKSFIGMFSFPALKAPGVRDCSHQSRGCY